MGLFASEKVVRIHFDKDGNITEKETKDWVEVLAELPFSLHEQYMKKLKAQMHPDGSYTVELGALTFEPEFFAKIIKSWSAEVPITVENIQKMNSKIMEKLTAKLREMYKLGA